MNSLLLGKGTATVSLSLRMANRHGLIAGATGTGKTVTLQSLAEGFSAAGVPVFMADVKGDLSGIAMPGGSSQKAAQRFSELGIVAHYQGFPTQFWDVFGEQGLPVRATVTDFGPTLFARLLDLNDTQADVLTVVFKIADDQGLALLDLKDLRAMLQYVGDHASEFKTAYGNISPTTIATVQRGLLALEQGGITQFFGEPALNIADLMRVESGKGVINVLAADKLLQNPRSYATMLLWLLAELFEELPEAGDLDKPKLVFFFDEAHLLFNDAPKALLEQVEQVVRLIRSKGVGIYFVTQNPLDVPETVLGQLGNRVQHALRAFTPRDQKSVKVAAQTFRPNKSINTEMVITELGVGEALVSFLDEKGMPQQVERVLIVPPLGRIGPLFPHERAHQMNLSHIRSKYEKTLDPESAYERLQKRVDEKNVPTKDSKEKKPPASRRQSAGEALFKSAARSIGTQLGHALMRGVLGALKR